MILAPLTVSVNGKHVHSNARNTRWQKHRRGPQTDVRRCVLLARRIARISQPTGNVTDVMLTHTWSCPYIALFFLSSFLSSPCSCAGLISSLQVSDIIRLGFVEAQPSEEAHESSASLFSVGVSARTRTCRRSPPTWSPLLAWSPWTISVSFSTEKETPAADSQMYRSSSPRCLDSWDTHLAFHLPRLPPNNPLRSPWILQ